MLMICPPMHIPASTELTEFFYILCRTLFGAPFAGTKGHVPIPAPYTVWWAFNDRLGLLFDEK